MDNLEYKELIDRIYKEALEDFWSTVTYLSEDEYEDDENMLDQIRDNITDKLKNYE